MLRRTRWSSNARALRDLSDRLTVAPFALASAAACISTAAWRLALASSSACALAASSSSVSGFELARYVGLIFIPFSFFGALAAIRVKAGYQNVQRNIA